MSSKKSCFRRVFEDNKAIDGQRERWKSRTAFILAAVGSAVGLGNFWRFPHLAFRHGGAEFFLPYLMCLFFLGIPMLTLETGLG